MKSMTAGMPQAAYRKRLVLFASLIIMALSLIVSGCSAKPAEKAEIDTVFKAINRLCEAKTLKAEGTFDITTFGKGDIELWIDNDNQFEFAIQSLPAEDSNFGLYLKDGKTYLNYYGTKTASVAENIGIDSDEPMKFYNPLLDLSAEEREEIFPSVTKDKNTYTLEVDKNKLAQLLDYFGSVGVKQAALTVTLDDEDPEIVRSIRFEADIRSALLPGNNIKLNISLKDIEINEKLDIPWPSDLDSYKTSDED